MRTFTLPGRKLFAAMFIVLIITLLGVVLLELLPTALAVISHERPVVILDAGHGGSDPGVFAAGLTEKDISLEIARYLRDYLKSSGCRVIMVRNRDVNFGEGGSAAPQSLLRDLKSRVARAAGIEGDILISLHAASHSSPVFSGPQTLYSKDNPASCQLANSVLSCLAAVWPGDCTGQSLPSRHEILTASSAITVTVETGFLSNQTDRTLLHNPLFRKDIAKALCLGIINYLCIPPASVAVDEVTTVPAATQDDGYASYYEAVAITPGHLIPVQRPLPQTMEVSAGLTDFQPPEDTAAWALFLLEKLRDGPSEGIAVFPTVPPAANIDSVTIRDGTAIISFSPGLLEGWDSNIYNEETLINSIVRTVRSLPGVKRVQILLGEDAEISLAGHMVLGKIYE